MSKLGRPSGNADEYHALNQRFIRRENTYHLLLILLRKRALKQGDHETAVLIDQVIARANEGDSVKMDIVAMMPD